MNDTDNNIGAIGAAEAEMHQEGLAYLKAVREDAKTFDPADIADDNGVPCIDVRIQVQRDGSFAFHSGQSCYDTDHSGYWGAGSAGPNDSEWTLIQEIRDMVSQALDSAAEDGQTL